MILLIDNYDSFTYNIVEALRKNSFEVEVVLKDQITINDIAKKIESIEAFLFSPGPGAPQESHICYEILDQYKDKKPIFGICLGHQIIADYFGAQVISAPQIMHGKVSTIYHEEQGSLKGIPQAFKATRYHSLTVEPSSLPKNLTATCWTLNDQGLIGDLMGLQHTNYDIESFQFHPESIMTPYGEKIMTQFMSHL